MVRRYVRRTVGGLAVGALAVTTLMVPAHGDGAAEVVPLEQAGSLVGWGAPESSIGWTVPAQHENAAFTAISAGGQHWSIALTADGQAVILGASTSQTDQVADVPDAVQDATVTSVTSYTTSAGVVTDQGEVIVWPEGNPGGRTDVPDDLPPAVEVQLSGAFGTALLADGTVRSWGTDFLDWGFLDIPEGLSGVTSVSTGLDVTYALKDDGTVVAWGRDINGRLDLPAVVTDTADNIDVVDVQATLSQGGFALLSDGSLATWGEPAPVPAELAGATVAAIDTNGNVYAALDADGGFHVWGTAHATELHDVPTDLDGAEIASFSLSRDHMVALVTEMLEVEKPTIAGAAEVDEMLTGTPATFSGGPDEVANQWLADGVAIAGETDETLTLTEDLVGARITFQSTATKSAETVTSTSAPTAPVQGDTVTSTTAVSVTRGAYGKPGRVTVRVNGADGVEATGRVSVRVNGRTLRPRLSDGVARVRPPKTIRPGRYNLRASYGGSSAVESSTDTTRYRVVKGSTGKPKFKVQRKPKPGRKGKARINVPTARGLAEARGKVVIKMKRKGGGREKVKTRLNKRGKASVRLPRMRRGKWVMRVKYKGNSLYKSKGSKKYRMRVR